MDDLMSPLLLGLFSDGIEQRITAAAPVAVVTVSGQLCSLLFCADDSVLLDSTATQSNGTWRHHNCCNQHGMQVNVQKQQHAHWSLMKANKCFSQRSRGFMGGQELE